MFHTLFCSSTPMLRLGHRYSFDKDELRRMEEEEEFYFDQEDLMEDDEDSLNPLHVPLKAGMETEFDQQFNKILESRKGMQFPWPLICTA